jgi:hypothetical protein
VFAVSYITRGDFADTIAFYSRIIIVGTFLVVLTAICLFVIDMSYILVNVEVNMYGHMIIVDNSACQHLSGTLETTGDRQGLSIVSDSEDGEDEAEER